MANLFGSICLSEIDKSLIRTCGKNGKKYLTICINEKPQPDQFGNTHYVKVYNKDKEAKPNYIGDLKDNDVKPQSAEAKPAEQPKDFNQDLGF